MTHQEFLKQIGMEIKVSRIRKGVSVNELSELTGLSLGTLYSLENGENDAKILSYKRIADALQVEMKNFL